MPSEPQLIKLMSHYVLNLHKPGRNMNKIITMNDNNNDLIIKKAIGTLFCH